MNRLSIKKIKQLFLPKVGTIIETKTGKGKIIYIHDSKLRITCQGNAELNEKLTINDIPYTVTRVSDNKFNAEYIPMVKIDNPFAQTAKLI